MNLQKDVPRNTGRFNLLAAILIVVFIFAIEMFLMITSTLFAFLTFIGFIIGILVGKWFIAPIIWVGLFSWWILQFFRYELDMSLFPGGLYGSFLASSIPTIGYILGILLRKLLLKK